MKRIVVKPRMNVLIKSGSTIIRAFGPLAPDVAKEVLNFRKQQVELAGWEGVKVTMERAA